MPRRLRDDTHEKPPPCTQADVARAAGVSVQTVSLVLRDRAGPGEATRSAVRAAAERLGYRPDPLLSALSAYRKSAAGGAVRARPGLALLLHGWVCEWQPELAERMLGRAKERAASLGFDLEKVVIPDSRPATFRRILRQLHHRRVEGLLLHHPLSIPEGLEEWGRFCCVVCNGDPVRYGMSGVHPNHYQAMRRVLLETHRLGYRRPVMIATELNNRLNDEAWSASFEHNTADYLQEPRRHIVLTGCDEDTPESMARAIAEQIPHELERLRPDVVIGWGDWLRRHLCARGWPVPGRVAYCDFDLLEPGGEVAGLVQKRGEAVELCVDLLESLVMRRKRGLAQLPLTLCLAPEWQAGASLPPRAGAG
jgi:LacI family transcriptional regulator